MDEILRELNRFFFQGLSILIITALVLAMMVALGCSTEKSTYCSGLVVYGSTSGQFGLGYGEKGDMLPGTIFYRDIRTETVGATFFGLGAIETNISHSVTLWDTTEQISNSNQRVFWVTNFVGNIR